MRVLLIPPTHHYATEYPSFLSFSDFPSGFGYLAAALKQVGHEVYGCNPNNIVGYANAYLMIQDVLSKKLAEVKPELIGLGGLCTDYKFLKDAIGIIRQIDSTIPIVLGGQIVTNDLEDVFNLLKPDYAVVGEGENAIVALASLLYSQSMLGEREPPTIITGDSPKLDSIPFPDYEPFGIQDMLDNYSIATRLLYRMSRPDARPYNIVASRGCPFACTFCIDHHRSYRQRSIENIMEEIRVTYERYQFNILIILDELFAVNKKRMNEFSQAVLKGRAEYGWDFDWMFQTHANAHLDLVSLKLAKQAGCYLFSYGLESASPTVLKSMKKQLKLEQVIEAIELAEEAQICFSANLIFGDVAETWETIAESLAFWLTYGTRCCIFMSMVSPYPGSKLFQVCQEKGLFLDKREYYEHIDQHPVNMTSIPDETMKSLISVLNYLEHGWLFTQETKAIECQQVNGNNPMMTYTGEQLHEITAQCPYCGEGVVYRQMFSNNGNTPIWIGVCCTKCQRKIKVEIR